MIVIGLGYGDEGKGLTTSYLCSQTEHPLVVRFNGGQQAGHTVVVNGHRHVFSNFGSGTLQGVPTYWSKHCTFHPTSFLNEYALLPEPIVFVNPLCAVTTPFDIDSNRSTEKHQQHGSVGMGFGATLQRQTDHYNLCVQDLFYPIVLRAKLENIANYYRVTQAKEAIDAFVEDAQEVTRIIRLADDSIVNRYTPIFEGAQGVLLDMDFGFFPNVTRSNTTTKNALEIYPAAQEVFYVTRSYLTRHGNGFMPNEQGLALVNNEHETNQSHEFQGEFRTAELNVELLNYALASDHNFSEGLRKNLVITCLDQYPIDVPQLLDKLQVKFDRVFCSHGDYLGAITPYE